MNRRGQKLDLSMYRDFCSALNDDYDGVRKAAIQLIHVLANTYPDEQVIIPAILLPAHSNFLKLRKLITIVGNISRKT